jgi:hypothetical protein
MIENERELYKYKNYNTVKQIKDVLMRNLNYRYPNLVDFSVVMQLDQPGLVSRGGRE